MRISDWISDVCSSDLLLVERVARGQHQHRRGLARLLAQALADLDAVQPRQHQVEHDHVVGVFGREAIAVETVGGVIDLEIRRASCRDRVWPYVTIPVVAYPLKKQIHTNT